MARVSAVTRPAGTPKPRPCSARAGSFQGAARSGNAAASEARRREERDAAAAADEDAMVETPVPARVFPQAISPGSGTYRDFPSDSRYIVRDALRQGEECREAARRLYTMGSRPEATCGSEATSSYEVTGFSTLDISRINEQRHNWQRVDTFQTPTGHISHDSGPASAPKRLAVLADTLRQDVVDGVRAEIQVGVNEIREELALAVNQLAAELRLEVKGERTDFLQDIGAELRQICSSFTEAARAKPLADVSRDVAAVAASADQAAAEATLYRERIATLLEECSPLKDVSRDVAAVAASAKQAAAEATLCRERIATLLEECSPLKDFPRLAGGVAKFTQEWPRLSEELSTSVGARFSQDLAGFIDEFRNSALSEITLTKELPGLIEEVRRSNEKLPELCEEVRKSIIEEVRNSNVAGANLVHELPRFIKLVQNSNEDLPRICEQVQASSKNIAKFTQEWPQLSKELCTSIGIIGELRNSVVFETTLTQELPRLIEEIRSSHEKLPELREEVRNSTAAGASLAQELLRLIEEIRNSNEKTPELREDIRNSTVAGASLVQELPRLFKEVRDSTIAGASLAQLSKELCTSIGIIGELRNSVVFETTLTQELPRLFEEVRSSTVVGASLAQALEDATRCTQAAAAQASVAQTCAERDAAAAQASLQAASHVSSVGVSAFTQALEAMKESMAMVQEVRAEGGGRSNTVVDLTPIIQEIRSVSDKVDVGTPSQKKDIISELTTLRTELAAATAETVIFREYAEAASNVAALGAEHLCAEAEETTLQEVADSPSPGAVSEAQSLRAELAAARAEVTSLRESADATASVAVSKEGILRTELAAAQTEAMTMPEALALLAASNAVAVGVEHLRAELAMTRAEAMAFKESAGSASSVASSEVASLRAELAVASKEAATAAAVRVSVQSAADVVFKEEILRAEFAAAKADVRTLQEFTVSSSNVPALNMCEEQYVDEDDCSDPDAQ